MMAGLLLAASCSDIDKQETDGSGLTQDQVQDINAAIPERTEATFSGMYSLSGKPFGALPSNGRPDDFGFISSALSLDAEGADLVMPDNGYNWFSSCSTLETRNANYANPYIRYVMPYRQIGMANEIISAFPKDTQDKEALQMVAQARAIRAFDYMSLAPYFQFGYATAKDEPCIPILDGKNSYENNPRATVGEVYEAIIADLDYAIANLAEFDRGSDKSKVNINVAYGLRARANLAMGNYEAAASDAAAAMQGYTPASISEVSVPAFCDMAEHNWIWAIDITDDMVSEGDAAYATSCSWLSPFSANGYAAACQVTPCINSMLYDLIPDTDVRKGWWLDENMHSPNWANLSWNGAKGDAMATLVIENVKMEYLPYTNVKFGMKSGVGSSLNNNDWPLMRVEEMILLRIEALARSGQESVARQELEAFVKTYRDPSYTISGNRQFLDEIWFQRRVELWGEGFFTGDAKRMGKNIVRFHQGEDSNWPDAFKFNIASNDGWLNMRFPQRELDNNHGIVDNTGGSLPVAGQNGNLRDGVTD